MVRKRKGIAVDKAAAVLFQPNAESAKGRVISEWALRKAIQPLSEAPTDKEDQFRFRKQNSDGPLKRSSTRTKTETALTMITLVRKWLKTYGLKNVRTLVR